MGEKFLIDTNILIYYTADEIPEEEIEQIERIFEESFNISIVSYIEFLGWKGHTEDGLILSKEFIEPATIIVLEQDIAEIAIDLTRKVKITLPDAVIAATAIKYGYTLITRNEDDFKNIDKLKIYNPFKIKEDSGS
jgi:predicted nucleic acid-binding protein